MPDELVTALALLYKKKGKTTLTEKEFVFSASMDFRWFTPKEAQKFLDIALDSGLAESKDDSISLTFNNKSVNIPKGFKPKIEHLKRQPAPKGLFLEIVDHVSKESGGSNKEIIARINKKQERMEIEAEIAALLVANELAVDISKYVKKVESEIKARNN